MWGHQINTVTATEMTTLEKSAADAAGLSTRGRCRFFSLVVAYGDRGHPIARIIRDIFNTYFELIGDIYRAGKAHDLHIAWVKIIREIRELKTPFAVKYHGILHNVIQWLLYLEVDPMNPIKWVDHTGQTWENTNIGAKSSLFVRSLIDTYNEARSKLSASQYNGAGLADSRVDYGLTLQLVRTQRLKSKHALHAALETVISGATWNAVRIASEGNPEYDKVCPRCGQAEETDFHVFYDCKCNLEIDSEYVTKSQHLIALARTHASSDPAYWYRGIITKNKVTTEGIGYTDNVKLRYEGVAPDSWGSGTYFGDGSGGVYTKYPTLRRCGVGVAKFNLTNETLEFGAFSPLPGVVQTVARAEAFALHLLCKHASFKAELTFITDNELLSLTYHGGAEVATKSINADIFESIFCDIDSKQLYVSLLWMPSHTDDDSTCNNPNTGANRDDDKGKGKGKGRNRDTKVKNIPSWVTRAHIKGNREADRFAGMAARYAQLTDEVAEPIITKIKNLKSDSA